MKTSRSPNRYSILFLTLSLKDQIDVEYTTKAILKMFSTLTVMDNYTKLIGFINTAALPLLIMKYIIFLEYLPMAF